MNGTLHTRISLTHFLKGMPFIRLRITVSYSYIEYNRKTGHKSYYFMSDDDEYRRKEKTEKKINFSTCKRIVNYLLYTCVSTRRW